MGCSMIEQRIFISYAHTDSEFAEQLAKDLEGRGQPVWLDKKVIQVGDSISTEIEAGLLESDFIILVLSNTSVSRPWVQREYRAALNLQINSNNKRPKILPAVIDQVKLPTFLLDIQYADFKQNYMSGLYNILQAIGINQQVAPFVEILNFLVEKNNNPVQVYNQALKEQNQLILSPVWQMIVRSAKALKSEIEKLQLGSFIVTSYPFSSGAISLQERKTSLIQLPEISLTENLHKTNTNTGKSMYYLGMEGVSSLIEALAGNEQLIKERSVYLLPIRIRWQNNWGESDDQVEAIEFLEML